MSIAFAFAIGATCGTFIGYILAGMLAERASIDAAQQRAALEAELTLSRRLVGDLYEEIGFLATTLDATREREHIVEEMAREMNQ